MSQKEWEKNGLTLVFYKENEDDSKFSFLIKNEPNLTAKILKNVSNKKVKEKDFFYCQRDVFGLIEKNLLEQRDEIDKDYISLVKEELDSFTSNRIKFTLVEDPIIVDQKNQKVTFSFHFNQMKFEGIGSNKKIAKQLAYKNMCAYYFASHLD